MTDFPQAVRKEAARRANAEGYPGNLNVKDIASFPLGCALCRAVLDGALHLDPMELDKARWDEAERLASQVDIREGAFTAGWWRMEWEEYRRLVRKGWTPPEPVDQVEQICTELGWRDEARDIRAALAKLGLKIVKDEQ